MSSTIHLIYSGAFCPFHYGHLQLLNIVRRYLLQNDPMCHVIAYIAPAGDDYVKCKVGQTLLTFTDRCELIKIMTQDCQWTQLVEYGESSPDTLRRLVADHIIPKNEQVYEIGGIDCAIRHNIMNDTHRRFICVGRQSYDDFKIQHYRSKNFIYINQVISNINSTEIRHLLKNNDFDKLKTMISEQCITYLQKLVSE